MAATYCLGDIGPGESKEIIIGELPINVSKLVRDQLVMKVRVKGVKTFRARLWLACRIIKLAAKVAGCGIEIESLKPREDLWLDC